MRHSLTRSTPHPAYREPKALTILGVFLAALFFTAAVPAQDEGSQMSEFFEAIDVNIVNVEVFVTDKKGNPIPGLTRDDFTLLEDGEEQEITNFYAGEEVREAATVDAQGHALPLEGESGAAEPADAVADPSQSLHVVLFIDNRNIMPTSRNRVLSAVKDSLFDDLDPNDRVTLVSYNGALTVRRYPTADKEALLQGVEELAVGSPIGQQRVMDKLSLIRQMNQFQLEEAAQIPGQPPPDSGPDVGGVESELLAYAQREYDEVRSTVNALSEFVSVLSGVPGRKALVYVSDGLSLRPGEALFQAYDRASRANPREVTINPQAEARRFDATSYFEELGKQANAGRVTFYTILAKGRADTVSGAERSAFFSFDDPTNLGQNWDDTLDTIEYSNYRGSMEIMAASTGGRATLAALDFDDALADLKQDFESFYSLGYRSPHDDNEDHRIKVKVSNSDWRVRHRETHRKPSPDEQMAATTRSALMLESGDNPLGVRVEFGAPQPHEEKKKQWLVPILVKFPIARLALIPGESFHEGKVTIYVGAQDPDGNMSPVQKMPAPVRVPNDQMLTAMSQVAGYRMTLLMRPGQHRVAVTVRDELADVSSSALTAHAPDEVAAAVEAAAENAEENGTSNPTASAPNDDEVAKGTS